MLIYRLLDKYVSSNTDIANKKIATPTYIKYFTISCLKFSLSCAIDLYIFIPATANISNAGISIILLTNIIDKVNNIPFPIPKVIITAEIEYPMQNPLYPIKIYVPNMPIIDILKKAIKSIVFIFLFIFSLSIQA